MLLLDSVFIPVSTFPSLTCPTMLHYDTLQRLIWKESTHFLIHRVVLIDQERGLTLSSNGAYGKLKEWLGINQIIHINI